MRARTSVSILFGLLLLSTKTGAEEWFPWAEAEGRVSTERSVVRGNIFAPVWQSEDSFFFFDIRGLTTNQDANEGNLGFGYRKLVGPDRLVGLFGYYDFRETEFGNQYHQASLGAEMLSSKWGFRINGYLPEDDADVVSGLNTAFLSGNNVFVRQGLEAAYWGADIELERLLWSNTDNGKGGKAPLKVAEFDAEWWASVGYFHFDQSDPRFESISGPRARTELRLWNLPLLGNDSRVMLTGQYDYDEVRGSVGTAGLSVRIPIGRYQSTAAPLSGIRRRMLETVVRDIDIVTNAGAFGDPERAKFARTGELINGTVSVDGNTADPEAVIEGAGVNSLVIASGAAGTIFPAGTIDMNDGQVILGGGSVIGVVGCDTGAVANFAAAGTRPTFDSLTNNTFNGANNGSIVGVRFGSSLNGSATPSGSNGIFLTNVSNFLFDDVDIFTTGLGGGTTPAGSAIFAENSEFVLANSRIKTIGTAADGIEAPFGGSFVVRNSTIDAGDDGIDSSNGTVYTVLDSTIISEDDTLDIGEDDQVRIIRTTLVSNAQGSADSLIDARPGSQVTILDSTLIANPQPGGDAVSLEEVASFVMKNSTLTVTGGEEVFEVEDVGTFTIEDSTITINDSGQATVGFFFQQAVDSTIRIVDTTVTASALTAVPTQFAFDLETTDSATVSVHIINSTIKSNGPAVRILARSNSTLTGYLTNNTITATRNSVEGETRDTATLGLDISGNTLSSGNTFFDFDFEQTGGTFNVVDFSNLSGNNNGASVNTTGTINDIPALP